MEIKFPLPITSHYFSTYLVCFFLVKYEEYDMYNKN